MKLTKREKILLPTVLIIILSALFLNFFYLPIHKNIKELEIQTDSLNQEIQVMEDKSNNLNELKQDIEELSKQIDNDYSDILRIWDQAELLVLVENMVSKLSEQQSIDFFDVTDTSTLQAGVISLSFQTNYKDLKEILHKLENADYFNTISNYSITARDLLENEDYDLDVTMDLRFYSVKLDNEYPDDYGFMKNKYGKNNIFKLKN